MSELQTFRNSVENFLSAHDFTPTRFGKEAAGDPLFVFQIRSGREPRSATREKVLSFISAHGSTRTSASPQSAGEEA